MNQSERFPLRRLLALAALSAGLHLATLAWIGMRAPRQERAPAAPAAPLSVRLLAAGAPPPAGAPSPPPLAPPLAPARRAPAPVATASRPAAAPAAPDPVAPAAAAPVAAPGRGAEVRQQMPGRYNVRLPPPVVLSFDVSEGPALTPRAAPSRLIWQTDAQHYSLRLENVPDNYGGAPRTFTSEGGVNDGGVAPDSALEQELGGSETRTTFEREAGTIGFASGATALLSHSTQDTASLLMQLAGIGLANPDQMRDTVEFEVAASRGHVVVRFDVSGPEQLSTPSGELLVWHLTEQAGPDQIRLEVWLAPAMSWYPVQLRTSGPNGLIALQRLRAAGAAQPP